MNKDFKEMLECFNAEGVEYLIVGGYALIEYTEPRYTKDLDLWIRPEPGNAARTISAITRFGAPLFGATVEDLSMPGNVLQIGMPPLRIDIITSIDGIEFAPAWSRRVVIDFDGVPSQIISGEDLLTNKRSTGRARDEEEADILEKALKLRNK